MVWGWVFCAKSSAAICVVDAIKEGGLGLASPGEQRRPSRASAVLTQLQASWSLRRAGSSPVTVSVSPLVLLSCSALCNSLWLHRLLSLLLG